MGSVSSDSHLSTILSHWHSTEFSVSLLGLSGCELGDLMEHVALYSDSGVLWSTNSQIPNSSDHQYKKIFLLQNGFWVLRIKELCYYYYFWDSENRKSWIRSNLWSKSQNQRRPGPKSSDIWFVGLFVYIYWSSFYFKTQTISKVTNTLPYLIPKQIQQFESLFSKFHELTVC